MLVTKFQRDLSFKCFVFWPVIVCGMETKTSGFWKRLLPLLCSYSFFSGVFVVNLIKLKRLRRGFYLYYQFLFMFSVMWEEGKILSVLFRLSICAYLSVHHHIYLHSIHWFPISGNSVLHTQMLCPGLLTKYINEIFTYIIFSVYFTHHCASIFFQIIVTS